MWWVLRRGTQMGERQANTHTTLDLFAPSPPKKKKPKSFINVSFVKKCEGGSESH